MTFLVFYAFIDLISKTVRILFPNNKLGDIFVFIHVKNQQDNVEYIVRTTIINYLHKYGGRTVPFIVIVDKGSTDKTASIAQKLCNDYDFLYYTTYDKYIEFKEQIGR